MSDLKSFTRDLMCQAEKDLGTSLDWIGVDHWNTDNPHIHIILRGRADDGKDLVIARDYISEGMRARAQDLVTQELGSRSDLDIRRHLDTQIEAERWTRLDRQLVRDAGRHGIIDVAPIPGQQPDDYLPQKVGRLRKLESLGLAHQVGPGQWAIANEAEPTLRALGERGDIIKRMHRALAQRGVERSASSYVVAGESLADPITGRLIDRGLDDELKGTAYAVVDGTDGRTHHIKLPDLDAAGDGPLGSIVELRRFEDSHGRARVALAVRSDLDLDAQLKASGATWIDRQLIAREPVPLGGGFGAEVRAAMESRAEHLIEHGLAHRQGQQAIYARNLLETLRRRELDSAAEKITAEIGLPFRKSASGESVAGLSRQRLMLASGRFAMIDDGPGRHRWSATSENRSPASHALMAASIGTSAESVASASDAGATLHWARSVFLRAATPALDHRAIAVEPLSDHANFPMSHLSCREVSCPQPRSSGARSSQSFRSCLPRPGARPSGRHGGSAFSRSSAPRGSI
jgi:type IV secretory pathway VirD2 relaxase